MPPSLTDDLAGKCAGDFDAPAAARQIHALLSGSGATVAVAESCTGGALSALFTAQPGASRYFLGGVVAYADLTKCRLLALTPDLLHTHGAVSCLVATHMASQIRLLLDADYGLATTGIAGPDGATHNKPVGTVWAAIATRHGPTQTWLMFLSGGRVEIIDKSCFYVLNKLSHLLSR